jgi:diguanylate cyclase (GGDEF)-like protein
MSDMLGHLKSALKASPDFPSPPAIAQQIIALARDPHTDISQVAATIGRDPALAAKLLRGANSVLYSRQRKSTNLRQALMVLGLRGATTLALSFSLVGTYIGLERDGMVCDRHWRRAILNAFAARCFGALQNASAVDDIFLAALLQDIAVLGVERTSPDFYRELPRHASHRERSVYETLRLGIDHAELGAWLLQYWRLPEPLCRAVAWSHAPPAADRSTPTGMAACCVALGSECVEILLAPAAATDFALLAEHASEWMGLGAPVVIEVMENIAAEIPEIERLFDMKLLQPEAAGVILGRARPLLMAGDVRASGQAGVERPTDPDLEVRTATLQDAQRRDGLTGLYNRGYLDLMLRREFQAATGGRWPLSLVFVDLDRFKDINDAHGQDAGDSVLVTTAKSIASVARDTDCVARYGGTEFVIVLPGLASPGAEIFCERLIARLRGTLHTIGDSVVNVTASVGLATHAPEKPFQLASHLINAAERSAFFAKRSGRDRMVRHRSGGALSAARN